ncbi:MAG: HgcAB-associated protein HgcC [Promethearchaeota archaeon]
MTKINDQNICCESSNIRPGCCKIESVITIDSKGQLLLPKEVRESVNLKAGDKLVVVNMTGSNDSCCILLIKAENFGDLVKNYLGPMMDNIFKK